MENINQTSHLTKRYGSKIAVNDLNLSIHNGEVFGLLGPNGAGKTTTILMLLGLTEPTAGTAEIAGCDCTRNPLEVKSMVGYLPDNVGFYGDMTGRQNLRFTGRVTGTGCITLIPMKTTPDKYHIIATLTRNEKVVTQVSSYYDISCFKLLGSVNVPAGSSLKKKGTTVILEMP